MLFEKKWDKIKAFSPLQRQGIQRFSWKSHARTTKIKAQRQEVALDVFFATFISLALILVILAETYHDFWQYLDTTHI